ncbi:MAG: SUMF1/EgtB/PvdO family nonheme iron enzyme [Candidatus Delongbacteria bacterium]|nr:SUMF1/EgtB/PvdO family nonheme iron enzyme [Candidatus Delongbacteria bacterium]
MVYVEGGTFQMGRANSSTSEPVHSVTLNDFYIGKYVVTQAQYEAIMGCNPSKFSGTNNPVENVNWDEAVEYCRKLSKIKGVTYRLPTEAEWEFAARGGNQGSVYGGSGGYDYAGSDDIYAVAWHWGNSNESTHQVGGKQPNELGIFDMSGNVNEWCSDWYDSDYYKNSTSNNPIGPGIGRSRVVRGGYWYAHPAYCRVFRHPGYGTYAELCRIWNRDYAPPTSRKDYTGFRVVRN